jgi:hypothetical protein
MLATVYCRHPLPRYIAKHGPSRTLQKNRITANYPKKKCFWLKYSAATKICFTIRIRGSNAATAAKKKIIKKNKIK